MAVRDAPSPLLRLFADVLHLHRHLASQVVLQGILATVGVVPVQAEGAPELRMWIESAMHKGSVCGEREGLTLESTSMMKYLNGTSMTPHRTMGLKPKASFTDSQYET